MTYEDASVCNFWHTWTCLGGKFPLFCSLWTHYETCSLLKRCVCTHLLTHESMMMCSFEHNFPLVHPVWRVSTKLYQLRDVTTFKFSLKRRISALVWLRCTPPCATFDICGHVWAESFHCFAHCERSMNCVHCKTTWPTTIKTTDWPRWEICMRTRPCKSKSCAKGRFFTVNTHHSPSRGSNQWSLAWFRMWKVAYIHVHLCENLHLERSS